MKPTINIFKKYVSSVDQNLLINDLITKLQEKYSPILFLAERSSFDLFDLPIFNGVNIMDSRGIGLALDIFSAISIESLGLTSKYFLEIEGGFGKTNITKITNIEELL